MEIQNNEYTQKQESLKRFLKYLEYSSDNLNLLLDAIALSMELQDWETTEKLITSALEHHPDSPDVNAHAGFLNMRANQLEDAINYFDTAIQNGIEQPAVIYNLAYSQFLSRQFEEALKSLSLIQETPALAKELAMLSARCKHNTDQIDIAAQDLEEYLIKSEDWEVKGLLSLLLTDLNRPEEAIIKADETLNQLPNNFDALLARGSSYSMLGQFEKAGKDYIKAAEVSPRSGRAWSGVAEIAFHDFEFDKAHEALESAINFMPDHIGTWHLLAWTHLMKNDLDQAENAFKKAYELDRSFGESHGGLATIYAMKGDIKNAEKHIKLARKLAPEGFSSIYAEMVLLNTSGQAEEAKKLFENAKDTPFESLGTTPRALIDKRIAELTQKYSEDNKPIIH